MNSFKEIVMLMLLFSFSLLVVHDFCFINTISTTTIVKQNTKVDLSAAIQKLELHHNIHILLDFPLSLEETIAITKESQRPCYNQKDLLSRVNPILFRPPISYKV